MGPWKIYSNIINGKTMYIAGRVIDTSKVFHSGNIEYFGQYTEKFQEAEELRDLLNQEEM